MKLLQGNTLERRIIGDDVKHPLQNNVEFSDECRKQVELFIVFQRMLLKDPLHQAEILQELPKGLPQHSTPNCDKSTIFFE